MLNHRGLSLDDVEKMWKTKGATDIPELASEYVLSPATAELELSIPDEISSWLIRVQLNNGSSTRGVEPTWTRERVIEIVGDTGVAKQLAAERTERHPARGWSDIQNDMVDAIELIASGGGPTPDPDPFEGLDVSSEHRADEVEAGGFYVARLPDQRSFVHFIPLERDLTLWYALGPGDLSVIAAAASDYVSLPLQLARDFGDGFPAISPFVGAGRMWARTPLVNDLATFTIAMRIRMASGNGQTILSLCNVVPRAGDDVPKLGITWQYTSGPSGQITATLVDGALNEANAIKGSVTHSAWHNMIIRFDGSDLTVRVDGTNGTPEPFPTPDDLHVEHTCLGCDIFPDGTANGQIFNGTAIRHILAAPRAWSDAECLTAEAALTAAWT
jgi:hypothetical protein